MRSSRGSRMNTGSLDSSNSCSSEGCLSGGPSIGLPAPRWAGSAALGRNIATCTTEELLTLGQQLNPVEEQPPPRGRYAGREHVAHDRVAKTEAQTVDAKDPAIAKPLESLGQLDGIGPEQAGEHLGIERLRERCRHHQHAIRVGALRAAARGHHLADRTPEVWTGSPGDQIR